MTNPIESKSNHAIEALSLMGKGLIKNDSCQLKLDFCLHRQLSSVVVYINSQKFKAIATRGIIERVLRQQKGESPKGNHQSDVFSLSGELADGRPVSIPQIYLGEPYGPVELKPWNCLVEIGRRGSGVPASSLHILTRLYEGSFKLAHGGVSLELTSNVDVNMNKKAAGRLGIPLEGSTLEIFSEEKTEEEHEDLARSIMLLLSLACGAGVTSNRWEFEYLDGHRLEFWGEMKGSEIGPYPILKSDYLKGFIEQALPVWEGMPEGEKSVLKTAITHLNNSGSGYLDNRIFQTAQIWEYLAGEWSPKARLSDAEQELKDELKKVRRQWDKKYPNADPNGFLGKRISQAFDWPVLKRQIECLAERFDVDLSTLGLEADQLRQARDSVAHTITLNEPDPSLMPHPELLQRSQYGLQAILLSKLEYTGPVIGRWKDCFAVKSDSLLH